MPALRLLLQSALDPVPAQSPGLGDNLFADECAYESTRPRAAGGPRLDRCRAMPVVIADKLSTLLRVQVDPGKSYFFRSNANEVRASLSECGAVKRQNEQHDRRNPKGHESAPS